MKLKSDMVAPQPSTHADERMHLTLDDMKTWDVPERKPCPRLVYRGRKEE